MKFHLIIVLSGTLFPVILAISSPVDTGTASGQLKILSAKIDNPDVIGIVNNAFPHVILGKPKHDREKRNNEDQYEPDPDQSFLMNTEPLPKLVDIQADCLNPELIQVSLLFDYGFNGIVYTKDHFNNDDCTFVKADSRKNQFNFTISTRKCGSSNNQAETNGTITEATLIVQNDALFQDANDFARRIRCAWSDRFDKMISSRGFQVGSLNENTMEYSADAVSVWMDLRMGKDPFSGTPVTNGVVRLGTDMTIAVYIKSKMDKDIDVVIKDCVANDAKKHQQIQLTDENGCILQKKLMTPFVITDRVGQSGASRVAYAFLKSFKFPDSLDVNIVCNVAMCRGACGISCADGHGPVKQEPKAVHKATVNSARVKREPRTAANNQEDGVIGRTVFLKQKEPTEVILMKGIRVLSDNDITEVLVSSQNKTYDVMATMIKNSDYVCVPKTGFAIGLALLLLLILILTIVTVFLACAACAGRKKKKTVPPTAINIYNSTEQLSQARSKGSSLPISRMVANMPAGSLANLDSEPAATSSSIIGSQMESDFKASAITLPGSGVRVQTNPHVRGSVQSLQAGHLRSPNDMTPILLPPLSPNHLYNPKALRLGTGRQQRPHSIAGGLDPNDKELSEEATRSLRSFSMVQDQEEMNLDKQLQGTGENVRSLRSYVTRPGAVVFTMENDRDKSVRSEAPRSLSSFTARPAASNKAVSDTTSENGEHDRSEGTLRSVSMVTPIPQDESEHDENLRSLRSITVSHK